MSLFRKKPDSEPDADVDAPAEPDEGLPVGREAAVTTGPFDVADAPDDRPRIDFGSVRVPAVDGMEVRVETSDAGQVVGVGVLLDGSLLQVQAFAAPRTLGIWDDVRSDLAASLRAQGGAVTEQPGRFGVELLARVPVTRPDGRSVEEPARFVGVDGPRWFLRGVISGAGATDPARAGVLEDLFAGIVVVRGEAAAPPREPLQLTLPAGPGLVAADEPAP